MPSDDEVRLYVLAQVTATGQTTITNKISEKWDEFRSQKWKDFAQYLTTKALSYAASQIPVAGSIVSAGFDMATSEDPPGATIAKAAKCVQIMEMYMHQVADALQTSHGNLQQTQKWHAAAESLAGAIAARERMTAQLELAMAEINAVIAQADRFFDTRRAKSLQSKIHEAANPQIEMTTFGRRV